MGERSWYERAAIIPGRSNTRSKAPGRMYPVGAGPMYAIGAKGAEIHCEDGEWYLDMQCALGAVSLGHNDRRFMPCGLSVSSLPYVHEVMAAESVLKHVAPWASQVRFVRTGSEAMSGALMVARRATGRRAFWRLRDSYHGWHEQWQLDDPDVRWFDVGEVPDFKSPPELPEGAGTFSTTNLVVQFPAAVIIEPPRWEEFTTIWLETVVSAAHDAGALVIFDEMIYGGRWALGGVIEDRGIYPDLACYGKALGNGAPVAMIVGRGALRDEGEAVSGTYSGDAGALAIMIDVIQKYIDDEVVSWMWRRGKQLRRGLLAEIEISGVAATVEGQPVHQRIKFQSEEIGLLFSSEMIRRAILWAPYSTNIMRAHTEAHIERVVDAAGESLRVIAGDHAERAGR